MHRSMNNRAIVTTGLRIFKKYIKYSKYNAFCDNTCAYLHFVDFGSSNFSQRYKALIPFEGGCNDLSTKVLSACGNV